jgi:hypothetical protein
MYGETVRGSGGNFGIRLWIMMRDEIDYEEFCRRGKSRQIGESPCRNA